MNGELRDFTNLFRRRVSDESTEAAASPDAQQSEPAANESASQFDQPDPFLEGAVERLEEMKEHERWGNDAPSTDPKQAAAQSSSNGSEQQEKPQSQSGDQMSPLSPEENDLKTIRDLLLKEKYHKQSTVEYERQRLERIYHQMYAPKRRHRFTALERQCVELALGLLATGHTLSSLRTKNYSDLALLIDDSANSTQKAKLLQIKLLNSELLHQRVSKSKSRLADRLSAHVLEYGAIHEGGFLNKIRVGLIFAVYKTRGNLARQLSQKFEPEKAYLDLFNWGKKLGLLSSSQKMSRNLLSTITKRINVTLSPIFKNISNRSLISDYRAVYNVLKTLATLGLLHEEILKKWLFKDDNFVQRAESLNVLLLKKWLEEYDFGQEQFIEDALGWLNNANEYSVNQNLVGDQSVGGESDSDSEEEGESDNNSAAPADSVTLDVLDHSATPKPVINPIDIDAKDFDMIDISPPISVLQAIVLFRGRIKTPTFDALNMVLTPFCQNTSSGMFTQFSQEKIFGVPIKNLLKDITPKTKLQKLTNLSDEIGKQPVSKVQGLYSLLTNPIVRFYEQEFYTFLFRDVLTTSELENRCGYLHESMKMHAKLFSSIPADVAKLLLLFEPTRVLIFNDGKISDDPIVSQVVNGLKGLTLELTDKENGFFRYMLKLAIHLQCIKNKFTETQDLGLAIDKILVIIKADERCPENFKEFLSNISDINLNQLNPVLRTLFKSKISADDLTVAIEQIVKIKNEPRSPASSTSLITERLGRGANRRTTSSPRYQPLSPRSPKADGSSSPSGAPDARPPIGARPGA